MGGGSKIGFIAQRTVNEAGKPAVCVSVGMVNSTRSKGEAVASGAGRFVHTGGTGSYELLVILNQIRHSKWTDRESHVGFEYTLDFPLSLGHGFPYILDMWLEENQKLTESGFNYTLSFPLDRGYGFPYILNMWLE